LNRNSRVIGFDNHGNEPFVAFALDLTGNAGTAIAGLTANTFVPLVTTASGNKGITVTANDVTDIQAAFPAGSSIVNVNLATAGTANSSQAIAIMALDRKLSYSDKIAQVKTRLDVGLRSGFDWQQVYCAAKREPNEGQGIARQLDLEYKATHGQRKYNLNHTEDPIVEFPSPIDLTLTYVRYNIEHISTEQVDTFNMVESPQKLVVLIPSAYTTTVSQWDSAIDSWLASAGSDLVTL
jgi:hypothetical protein